MPRYSTIIDSPDDWDNGVARAWFNGLRPVERLLVSQWAAKHRYLSERSSSEAGKWMNERTPYLVEIMDALSVHHPARVIVFNKGSQIGGTECGNNWAGYVMHHAPGPMLFVMPNIDDARFNSQQRLDTMIEESPVLRELVDEPRTRDGTNTRRLKMFPGGLLRMVGSNSARGLRSMPAKYAYLDEVDEYPDDVGGEGDPIDLIIVRQRTFGNSRKTFLTSSPTRAKSSKIAHWYGQTDQRRFFVPCPFCGTEQLIEWKRITFQRDDRWSIKPGSVFLECEKCNKDIREHNKTQMLASGRWKAEAVGRAGYVGFSLSALYSPLGWYSWDDAADEFLKARHALKEKKSADSLKVFVNTVLAEPWEDPTGNRVEWSDLYARRGGYKSGVVPKDGLMLTCGVDTQDDRLAVSVVAYGKYERSYRIFHEHLFGDPASPAVWRQLDEILYRAWKHESGAELRIVSAAIDSGGHRTHDVYNYVRSREPLVMAIKGASQPGRPAVGRPTQQDVNYNGRVIPNGVMLWPLGVDTIKTLLFSRMRLTEEESAVWYFHDELPEEYYRELTSEYRQTRYVKGRAIDEWVKDYPRSEALDCEVYAYAAALRAGITRMHWDSMMAHVIESAEKPAKAPTSESPGRASPSAPTRSRLLKKRRALRRSRAAITGG